MDAQEIKDRVDLGAIVETLTGHPRQGTKYHCPICGSGDGPNHTPAFEIDPSDPTHWHCFSGKCGRSGDVFDLAGFVCNLETFPERKEKVLEWAGITDDRPQYPTPNNSKPQDPYKIAAEHGKLDSWRTHISDPAPTAYLEARGIALEDAIALGLGYDPSRRRIAIPYVGSTYYHIDRAIDERPYDGQGKYVKPRSKDVGNQPVWNPDALEGEAVIVVEGPMDAIALELAGYGDMTVALGGTAYSHLTNALKARGYRGSLLVALDADGAGDAASEKLVAEALGMGIAAAPVTMGGRSIWAHLGGKDAGDAWQASPDALKEALAEAVPQAQAEAAKALEKSKGKAITDALKASHVVSALEAIQNVYMLKGATEPQPTGFSSLDRLLGGGLYAGLYILGATSSLGKTTFVGQLADNVAAQGRPVLFVTLEMSAEEMAAKSLSRYMALNGGRREGSLHLMSPVWRNFPPNEKYAGKDIRDACERYQADVGERLKYLVADAEPNVDDVRAIAQSVATIEGTSPLVVIDYLQILKSPADSLSDKQATDRNVSALRRLARDLKAPVLCVASLNRGGYYGTVEMDSFKESGAIEYGADVLLGLQPAEMGGTLKGQTNPDAAKKKARETISDHKRAEVRNAALTVIKNRWGRITGTDEGITYTYDAIANTFTEKPQQP